MRDAYRILVKKILRGRDYQEGLDIDVRITFRWVLQK
jgi:hypothetical protein